MAEKYIIHGATFNGDGTTSAEAASNGAAGAWNNINVFQGTTPAYGSLAAGDVVHIRSKSAAGADITVTLGATTYLGSTVGTLLNPVRWRLDDGTIWPGVSGTLTYRRTAAYELQTRSHNIIVAAERDSLIFADEHVSASLTSMWRQQAGSFVQGAWLDCGRVTFTGNGAQSYLADVNQTVGGCTAYDCRFTAPNKWYTSFIRTNSYGLAKLVNPRIEVPSVFSAFALFSMANLGARMEVYGGEISGAGATTGVSLATFESTAGDLTFYGTKIPQTIAEFLAEFSGVGSDSQLNAVGIDDTLGAIRTRRGARIDSRYDGFYPTLSAQHNDSMGTPWSWKVYPVNTYAVFPFEIPYLKTYTEAAAAKTIAVELLVGTSFAAVNKGNLWLDVSYIDNATGERRFVSTCDQFSTAALDSSTADWSATTYGAVAFDKHKLSVTTPTSVKQNTLIVATLRGYPRSSSANHILFVDGDISVV